MKMEEAIFCNMCSPPKNQHFGSYTGSAPENQPIIWQTFCKVSVFHLLFRRLWRPDPAAYWPQTERHSKSFLWDETQYLPPGVRRVALGTPSGPPRGGEGGVGAQRGFRPACRHSPTPPSSSRISQFVAAPGLGGNAGLADVKAAFCFRVGSAPFVTAPGR